MSDLVHEAAIRAAGGVVHWIDAAGGVRLRAAQWPEGDRGVVLLLSGRTEFIEKYLEPIGELQARGYAVWTLDWRGQGASTRPLADRHAHHIGHFGEYLGDLTLLVDRFLLPGLGQRPLTMIAHSMGGHIGAHFLSRRPEMFARAVLCAPMIDFMRGGPAPRWVMWLVVQAMCLVPGQARRFGPGTGRAPDLERAFEGNVLTSCPQRYAADKALVRETPSLGLGGVTWGWLRAALASIWALGDPRVIVRINMPVLVIMAGDDTVVDNRAIRRFAMALPRGKNVKVPGARHELLREHDRHRLAVWAAIDRFMEPAP